MSEQVIETSALGKRYTVGGQRDRYLTLRDTLRTCLPRRTRDRTGKRELWALRDITLRINAGEVVGIVGRNGAGKTTLLRILARITEPTTGIARTRGRVGALLEVGAGFHYELTGRENIYLSATVHGMTRRSVRGRFDDIVAFSGVEQFLDTPLKRFSTGMYLRLAFSVAAHLDQEILVVDEVLAMGDLEFQRKCLSKVAEIGRSGRTVLFVSHDLGAVGNLCSRCIWLDRGVIRADASADEVLRRYANSALHSDPHATFEAEAGPLGVVSATLIGRDGEVAQTLRRDEPLSVLVGLVVHEQTPGLDVGVFVFDQRGAQLLEEYWSDVEVDPIPGGPGEYELTCQLEPVLAAGDYRLVLWVGTSYETFLESDAFSFHLFPAPVDRQETRRKRLIAPSVRWRLKNARRDGTGRS